MEFIKKNAENILVIFSILDVLLYILNFKLFFNFLIGFLPLGIMCFIFLSIDNIIALKKFFR